MWDKKIKENLKFDGSTCVGHGYLRCGCDNCVNWFIAGKRIICCCDCSFFTYGALDVKLKQVNKV